MNYNDIINLDRYEPSRHKRMSMTARAAQFSSFAALTGFDREISEEARRTGERIVPDEEQCRALDEAMRILMEDPEGAVISAEYFVPDEYKDGGEYVTVRKTLRRISPEERQLLFYDGTVISFDDVNNIVISCYEDLDKEVPRTPSGSESALRSAG